ncbi:lysophospholipid acyltransferase family protein [Mucilaginibacter ginkgonis]|uniref:1-acyl-sn-glycerol-3-phosphate acyltransferase n=1 Tax=Mucilaginibacter ginkgonis TaxID=2682091 RepID=A0A6I4I0S1_9SPHI|nr:lysophospholipid acyltransferase family protein [Mucilaginibacter ginkgonis]QQL48359.1 1-acyl-sn-glycerol-3-phosphate acyltransferase [Mucilaginibacter ginkgonis]
MKTTLRKVHTYWYIGMVALFFCLLYPFLYFFSRKPSRYKYMNVVRKVTAFLSSSASGIFYKVRYEKPIDWSGTYIICPNHTSSLDASCLSLLMKNNYCFMGKEELLDNFVLTLYFKTIDITVNRDSKMSSFRAFKKAGERIAEGMSLIIFPEGKIPDDYPPSVHEFKNGPFRLAIDYQIPIIPITSVNTWQIMWDTGLEKGSRPGICDIFVHEPVDTKGLTADDADALKEKVYGIMSQKFAAQ